MEVSSVSDLVELVACVRFIEAEAAERFRLPGPQDENAPRWPVLVPHCTLDTLYYDNYHVHHLVFFRVVTEHPVERLVAVPGSNFRITAVARLPVTRAKYTLFECSGNADVDTAVAVRAAASLIREDIDPNSDSFNDAVGSRLRLFNKQKSVNQEIDFSHNVATVAQKTLKDIEDGTREHTAPSPSVLLDSKVVRVKAYAKPDKLDLDSLSTAFATHYTDGASGKGILINPKLPPLPAVAFQPLVFYSPISKFKFPLPPPPPTAPQATPLYLLHRGAVPERPACGSEVFRKNKGGHGQHRCVPLQ